MMQFFKKNIYSVIFFNADNLAIKISKSRESLSSFFRLECNHFQCVNEITTPSSYKD